MTIEREPTLHGSSWTEKVHTAWGRQPTRFDHRGELTLPVSLEELFEILLSVPEKRLFLGNEQQHESELFPHPDDQNFSGYEARLARTATGGGIAFVAGGLEQVCLPLWKWIVERLRPLHEQVGLPGGFNEISVFLGNYQRTPFGVHEDEAGVLAIPLLGPKRMRFWPPPFGQAHPSIDHSHHYDDYLEDSILIEASPGQAIYWPSGWWHVAEGGERTSLSWSVGFWDPMPGRLIREATDALLADLLEQRPGDSKPETRSRTLPYQFKGTSSTIPEVPSDRTAFGTELREDLCSPDRIARFLRSDWLRRYSGLGFRPPFEISALPPLPEDEALQVDPRFPILWQPADEDSDEILHVAALGQVLALPAHPAILRLLERLSTADPVRWITLVEMLQNDAGSDPADPFGLEELRTLVGALERIHALRRVAAPPA